MRPFSTDRPDRTESPYSVDAGHIQIEMDAVAYKRDEWTGAKTEQWGVAITNLKLGLARRADVQLVLESRVRDRLEVTTSAGRTVSDGWRRGNAIARLKCNVWGNDGGRSALAVMPFAALRGDAPADFGLIVPFGLELPHGLGLGAMAQAEWEYVDEYEPRWIGSATIGRTITGSLSGFVELWGALSRVRDEENTGTFDAGLVYALGESLKLDTGLYVGLNDASDDLATFVGLSFRH